MTAADRAFLFCCGVLVGVLLVARLGAPTPERTRKTVPFREQVGA